MFNVGIRFLCMRKIIRGGRVINEGRQYSSDVLIENDRIVRISADIPEEEWEGAEVVDATDCYVLPGVIDEHVHFREPGLTHKGNIAEGSLAAAAGGVTSFMDMPNVVPPTTTVSLLERKQEIASSSSVVNFSFYMGATTDNIDEVKRVNPQTTCGIKVFMGSSTGNMLMDSVPALERLFAESPLLIAAHCEDTSIIGANLSHYKEIYGDDIPPRCHPMIRSREACLKSSSLAVALARKYGSRLHILHLSTADEIALLDKGELRHKRITGEACVNHLWFNDEAYLAKGNLVKCNPSIKTEEDRKALLFAVQTGLIDVVATDHAPHTLTEKSGPYTRAASGCPMIQHSLPLMLELTEKGVLSVERVVDCMCHAPAEIFGIEKRGYIREGYRADLCLVYRKSQVIIPENILYQCAWSPLTGETLHYQVKMTIVNGNIVYDEGRFATDKCGELLTFDRG